MPLRKRVIDLPIKGGLDQKISDKNLISPKMLKLTNGRYIKEGRIDKRFGYSNLGLKLQSGTLTTPTSIGAIRDELLMTSADKLYSFTEATGKWNTRGTATVVSTKLDKITASPTTATNVDAVTLNDIKVAIWYESTSWYYTVKDQATGANIVDKTVLVADASSLAFPRVTATDDKIGIFYIEPSATTLKGLLIPTSAPTTSSTSTIYSGVSGPDANGAFEVQGHGSSFYLFFKITASATSRLSRLDTDLTIVATNTITSVNASGPSSTTMSIFNSISEGKDIICLGWHNSSDNKYYGAVYDILLTSVMSSTLLNSTAFSNEGNLVIIDSNNADGKIAYAYMEDASVTYQARKTVYNVVTISTANVGATALLQQGAALLTKAIKYNNVSYVTLLIDSPLQPTYYAMSFTTNSSDIFTGQVIAKWAAGVAGTYAQTIRAGNLSAINSTEFEFGCLKKGRIQSAEGNLFADTSPHTARLSFNSAKGGIAAVAQKNYNIASGILSSYDGRSLTEYGFNMFPEDIAVTTQAAGTTMTTGDYLIYVVYEWVDDQGIRQQSAPSIAVTGTIAGGSEKLQVDVGNLNLTQKVVGTGDAIARRAVNIKVYATEANGTVPYYVAETTNQYSSPAQNNFVEITADPTTSNEILYTSGGALENIAPPAHTFVFTHDNRFVIVGLENSNEIRFSKEFKPLEMPGFNEDLAIILDPTGGDAVAGASMDNNMIIFKENAVYSIAGSGPNDLGEGSTYGAPQLIAADIGCKDVKSILQLPEGVIFKSAKGIYLLDRSLTLSYIGSPVEDYNSATILSSDILKTSEEVRFVTDADVTLVYNYFFKRWSVYTTPGALDATTWKNDEYVYLTPTKALKEDSSTYLDDGSYVSTTLRTSWVHLKSMQGYQRVYRLGILGSYGSNHQFQVKTYLNYSDIVRETHSIIAASVVNVTSYGDSDTYGSEDYYGGPTNLNQSEVYQLRVHLAQQKCESISFEISDSQITGSTGQGFSLEGLSLEVGGKGGIFRLSQTRSN